MYLKKQLWNNKEGLKRSTPRTFPRGVSVTHSHSCPPLTWERGWRVKPSICGGGGTEQERRRTERRGSSAPLVLCLPRCDLLLVLCEALRTQLCSKEVGGGSWAHNLSFFCLSLTFGVSCKRKKKLSPNPTLFRVLWHKNRNKPGGTFLPIYTLTGCCCRSAAGPSLCRAARAKHTPGVNPRPRVSTSTCK